MAEAVGEINTRFLKNQIWKKFSTAALVGFSWALPCFASSMVIPAFPAIKYLILLWSESFSI